jgi:hypothetical protein
MIRNKISTANRYFNNKKRGDNMIKVNDIMTENQKVILEIFNDKKTIEKAEKEIKDFNKKTENFLKNVDELAEKIKFNF